MIKPFSNFKIGFQLMAKILSVDSEEYPFVQEFLADSKGEIQKVVLTLENYQRLLEIVADEDLYQAMNVVRDESPLSREEALLQLESED